MTPPVQPIQPSPQDVARIQANVAKMRDAGAPESDVLAYLQHEDSVTAQRPAVPQGNSGLLATFIDNLGQGITFGQSRKMAAALGSVFGHGSYEQNLAELDANLAAQRKENPTTSTLSEMAGVAASPVARLMAGVYRGLAPASAVARAATGAATAGTVGAGYGAATAPPGQRLQAGAVSGLLSALTGGVASAPGSTLGRVAAGTGLGAATGATVGELTGHPGSGAVLGGVAGMIGGARIPITDAERAQTYLNLLPENAAQTMAEVERLAPGGSSLAGAAPRPDNPAKSRLWRALKGVGADEAAGADAEQATQNRLDALEAGRKLIGKQMNQVAGPIPVDERLAGVLKTVRKALGNQTPGYDAEDPIAAQIRALYKDDPGKMAVALSQLGAGTTPTVDAADLADALSSLNTSLRVAARQGVDANGVRKYTIQQAHDALEGYLSDQYKDLKPLQRQYAVLSDQVRRLGPKGIQTKIADSRENFAANTAAGKGAVSVGGSLVGQAAHSPKGAAFSALQNLFRPDEAKAGARFAARYLLDPTVTPTVLQGLLQSAPPPAGGVLLGSSFAPLNPLLRP